MILTSQDSCSQLQLYIHWLTHLGGRSYKPQTSVLDLATSLGISFGIPWSHDVTSLYQTDYRKHVLSQKRKNMFSPSDPIPYSTSARAKELENRKMCFFSK